MVCRGFVAGEGKYNGTYVPPCKKKKIKNKEKGVFLMLNINWDFLECPNNVHVLQFPSFLVLSRNVI